MKKDVMKQWVHALRSGKYKQGMGRLRSKNNHYCCLGVLCDISKLAYWEEQAGDGFSFTGPNHTTTLPPKVVTWAGLNSSKGKVPDLQNKDNYRFLTVINDVGTSFEIIADLIETHYEQL